LQYENIVWRDSISGNIIPRSQSIMRLKLPLALAISAISPALAHAQAALGLIPIESFVREDQYFNPKMSPDGKHLAVTVRTPVGKRTIPMVTFYSLPDLKLESTIRMPLFSVPVSYQWVSNTRLVVEKGIEVGSREAPRATGEVLAMDFDGTNQAYLYGHEMTTYSKQGGRYGNDWGYASPAYFPDTRNDHVQLGTYLWRNEASSLYDVDTRSAIRKELTTIPVANATFVVQNDGKPRFVIATDEQNYLKLWRYSDATGKWAMVEEKPGSRLSPNDFSADNKEFLAWYSEHGGPSKLVRQKLDSDERRVVAEDEIGSIDRVMHASSHTLPVAAFTHTGRPRVIYLEPSHPDVALHQALSAQFPDATVNLVSATDDGSKLLAFVHSDRDPGVVYLYDRKANKADQLYVSMGGIDPDQMAPRRPIKFKARDGLLLECYLTLPKLASGAKPPLILLPHGGPHGLFDTWYFDTDAQFLASRGYAVLQVNYRGSGGRGEHFKTLGYREWGGKILDDLVDGVKWTVAQGAVDGTRMCAYGGSFGAYAALMLAAREPDMFKCAVGYAGIYELPLLHKEDQVKGNSRMSSTFVRYIGEDAAELARYSPAQHAASIKAGVLLIHGGHDETAPKEHAFLMKEALEKAGHAPEWYYVDYEGHGFYDTENQTEVYKRLEAFFAKYLGKPK
jgi:dipeptidyl aminopeptidase/acylaminoacyl peptidase